MFGLVPTLPGSFEDQARNRALEVLDINPVGVVFTLFINESYIRSEADKFWSDWPKQVNEDGHEDPNGPTHFSGLSVNFHSPDRITTSISGYDERPWPDADFVFTITDTFDVSSGDIQVASTEKLDVDTSILNLLTGLFLLHFPPLGLVFLAETIYITTKTPDKIGVAGAGSYVNGYIPREIMVDEGKKVLLSYLDKQFGGVVVSEGGVFCSGWAATVDREPSIESLPSRQLIVVEGQESVEAVHVLITHDLRPNLLIEWSVDDSVVQITTSNGLRKPSATIRYNCTGITVSTPRHRKLSVKVTDADNLQAVEECAVHIHARHAQDPEEPDLPPICQIRPWLPQCHPDEP